MRSKLLSVVISTVAIVAASQASAYEPQTNSVSKEKQEAEKKICRWLPVTGSNINQRVCLTEEDWKKAEALSWL